MKAEHSEIGRRLRQIRHARGKSLAVIAGMAGISAAHLSRLENGERALDRRSLIVKLAEALEVAPGELTLSPVAIAPGELAEDRFLNAVRLAMLAVSMNQAGGQVVPPAVLSARVDEVLTAQRDCQYEQVGAALPDLIRDLHTTLATGRGEAEVLRLLALTHVQGTQAWLMDIGAPLDLGWQAATLARQAAERLDQPLALALSAFGTAFGLLGAGAFALAERALAEAEIGTARAVELQVSGMLALTRSLVAAACGDQAGRTAALAHAAELAERTGEGNALWFGFGPGNVGVWRMSVALEAGEHLEAAKIAETINPGVLPSRTRQAAYWREYGRALARLPRRQDDAVLAIRRAELISPARVRRHPFMRSVLAELVVKAKRDAVGRELRGMAYRAGLPV
ncbi:MULTISPECIES: helix-turn-helix transcriptional regulator [unclassified Crossiella]|uniref:helix-turn-helix domain-containing protein n=1 Tax=unclassified Crossiella TaxID=2620835 RepID=UPI001FFE506D|nr:MULTISPECIES: helix-turn-helix transcriptional regulator [unclassified Crossiella]MCK2243933.1 helix-turn-helix domain-containing protein [Crossiella sp. S99.2]MCK2257209.1 helix-turn-helix domain-containing protein [Crossiella sp. S99.1]